MRFGILKKFLAAFLVLSLLPLLVLSFYARQKVTEVGATAVRSSRKALTRTSMSLLEARARAIAQQVELFLQSTADDLKTLATLPVDPDIYRDFYRVHQRRVWIRTGTPEQPVEERPRIPTYREIAFADPDGVERLRVTGEGLQQTPRDVSQPFRSAYGPEDYFNRARALPAGEFFVSHLVGRHIRPHEQLQGAASVETAIGGREYRGIIRFAMALYRDGAFAGVVSLALDHRHLMEYTQHVLPIGSSEVVFPSYASGNYAFLFDNEGWIITHPKFWDIRGWDRDTGQLVDPQSPAYDEARLKAGEVPFNLLHVPFIHTNYRFIALETMDGRAGVTQTSSVGGVPRVLAFAPIRFAHGVYAGRGFFGGVTLGAQTEAFHRLVEETTAAIDEARVRTVQRFVLIIIVAGVVVGFIALFLARSFTRPIRLLAQKVREINQGHYDFAVDIHSGDELEVLGHNFQEMGHQLERHRRSLMASLQELQVSKEEIERYNRRLENQVAILKTIHALGHELSVNFDRDKILDTVVDACVEGLGFERAIVYLFDPAARRLECAKVRGFADDVTRRAYGARYHVDHHDCLPTRAFRTGQPIMVRDVASDRSLTDLDRRIAAESRTASFAFAPIRVADRNIGVLGADYAASSRPISDEAMESLKIVANDAALALERARLMDDVVKERDFIESIFANMLSGLLVVDTDGRVQSVNRKAEQFIGAAAAELVGRPMEEVLGPYPPLLEQFRKTTAGEEALQASIELESSAGRPVHLETAISCIRGTGTGGSATLLIFRDVTQRKKMETHLRRSDRLVSLGTLAAGIAHEIRNPLTGISLLLDDLHDRMANRTDERLMMQSALEEIEKLEKIVTELLEFASTPSSRRATRDLNKVVDHTLFFVHKQLNRQGVTLERDTPASLPPIRLDPEKMKQALLNILLNALNVLPEGGTIRMTSRLHERLDTLDGRRAVELRIADDGPGIHPDDIEYIFDPFFTRNPHGFGLGLSITHTIVDEHEGHITVESTPGQGTRFRIFLPAESEGNGNGKNPGR